MHPPTNLLQTLNFKQTVSCNIKLKSTKLFLKQMLKISAFYLEKVLFLNKYDLRFCRGPCGIKDWLYVRIKIGPNYLQSLQQRFHKIFPDILTYGYMLSLIHI